jgi:hypothetical protein
MRRLILLIEFPFLLLLVWLMPDSRQTKAARVKDSHADRNALQPSDRRRRGFGLQRSVVRTGSPGKRNDTDNVHIDPPLSDCVATIKHAPYGLLQTQSPGLNRRHVKSIM